MLGKDEKITRCFCLSVSSASDMLVFSRMNGRKALLYKSQPYLRLFQAAGTAVICKVELFFHSPFHGGPVTLH